jgi:hypothetical protein
MGPPFSLQFGRLTMKYLIVAGIIAALSIVATDARANNITDVPAVIGGTSDFTAIHADNDAFTGGHFTDTFTFNLSGALLARIFIRESDPIDQPGSTISFISADLNGVQLNLFGTGFLRFLPSTPFTGPLVLTVTGVTDAGTVVFADGSTSTSSYFGRLMAVPEPSTFLFLGIALAAGLAAWRWMQAA